LSGLDAIIDPEVNQEDIRGGSSLFCKREIAEKYFKGIQP
jgi:hypothetical protein